MQSFEMQKHTRSSEKLRTGQVQEMNLLGECGT